MFGNLVMLNLLWILCSLPIITMGAATTALYYTLFQYQTNDEDAVLKPFFKGFAQNFKQATLLWLPMMAALLLMLFNIRYLFAIGGSTLLWTVVIFMTVLLLLMNSQMLPMLARFNMTNKEIIRSTAALSIMHFLSCLLMTALNAVPIVAFFADVYLFVQISPLWACLWFSVTAYLNSRTLLKIWQKHMPEEEKPEDTEETEEIEE